jgi:murein DD-endopeptidase MepM/ murein hydrolase activator NlpD
MLVLLMACLWLGGDPSERIPDGGGPAPVTAICLDEAARLRIKSQLEENRAMLRAQGLLGETRGGASPLFIWPVVQAPGFYDRSFWAVTNFVDQDPNYPDMVLDYNGGTRTYDTTGGYNHRGIDIRLWPISWEMMDREQVQVVAAAPGTIIGKYDGNFDRSCQLPSPMPDWNAVYVEHDDGSVTWYGHLKNGSVTPLPIGSTLAEGEYIGLVGSSGNSTSPHLHFEVYDAMDNLIEPYAGPFNMLNTESWWQDQKNYYEQKLLRLETHHSPPSISGFCPEDEVINREVQFQPEQNIYLSAWYRDQLMDVNSEFMLIQPDGQTYSSWSYASPYEHLSVAWWYWFFTLASWAPPGVWTFQANFDGDIVRREFLVGSCHAEYEALLVGWPDNNVQEIVPNALCAISE